jgi:hypothetical protein
VLQLGGSESDEMAQCAKIAQDWGYDEVNINVVCHKSHTSLHDLLALAIKMLSNGGALTRDTKAKTHSTHGFVLGIACWSSNTGDRRKEVWLLWQTL